MGEHNIVYKSFIGLFAGVFAYLQGAVNEMFAVLAILMVCDYVSGATAAMMEGSFSVKKGVVGAIKKSGYLLLIVVCFLLDYCINYMGLAIGMNLETNGMFGYAITCYLIGTEGLSCLKCLTKMGLPVPAYLQQAFGIIKQKGEGEN